MATGGRTIMKDSYIGGIVSSSFIPQDVDTSPFAVDTFGKESSGKAADDQNHVSLKPPASSAWDFQTTNNQTDEDKLIHLTSANDIKTTNINKTEEYNIGYAGLSILPWEEFVVNPRVLNELFYPETNQKITFDPDEVNVFFHGKNVMPPSVGDISENGKSWNITAESVMDLRKIRTCLTERCSVFGVTLEYKDNKFAKPVRAPCLVLMDPSKGTLGDRLYTTMTRAMDSLHNDRSFCIEINLNGCVERWCRRVLLTDCKAVGAKIIITNGEEYEELGGTEDVVCCIFCFPVWVIQACVYKLHRKVVYDDFLLNFDAEDLFLHGSVQDSSCQRQYIFNESENQSVFRTQCAERTNVKTLQELGTHKFVCVKKVDKTESEDIIKEHNTSTFGALVNKRKDKIIAKDSKMRKQLNRKDTDDSRYSEKEQCNTADKPPETKKETKDDTEETAAERKDLKDSKYGFTNKGFIVEDNYNEAFMKPCDGGETPRIPELCDDEPEQDNIELDIPSEIKNDDHLFSPRTQSRASVLEPLPSIDFIRKRENKSLTALCSFEYNGSGSDGDDESETDTEHEVKEEAKETLLGELSNIDKTLPLRKPTEPTEKSTEEETKDDGVGDKNKKSKQKGRDKPKMGKLLKDLTKTTTTAKKDCPSKTDARYHQAKEKLKEEKKKNKRSSEKEKQKRNQTETSETDTFKVKDNDDAKRQKPYEVHDSIEYVTAEMNESLNLTNPLDDVEDNVTPEAASHAEKQNDDNTSSDKDDCVQEFTVDDSSTDGDEVEMIYQKEETQLADDTIGNVYDTDDAKTKTRTVGPADRRVSPIDLVATSNKALLTMGMSNIKPLYKPSDHEVSIIDDDIFGTDDQYSEKNKNATATEMNGHNWNVTKKPIIRPNAAMSLDLTEVVSSDLEHDLDLADIDEEGNEVTLTTSFSAQSKVPPLMMNYPEAVVKKTKRATKRVNSNMRYLGSSVPAKSKKQPR